MDSETDVTYRLIVLEQPDMVGRTAATPELAKLMPPDGDRTKMRLGLERTEWADHFGKMRINRTILVEAEQAPGEWMVGLDR